MTESSLIGHAEELVRIIRKSSQPGDQIASEYYRSKKYIGAKDRRFIGEWTFHTLRTLATAEAYYQAHPHDGLGGPVEAAIAMSRDAEASTFLAELPECTRINTQPWLLQETLRRWPDAAAVWQAMTQEAPFTIRVNLRRTTRAEVLQILQRDDIPAHAGVHAPAAIIIGKRVALTQHPLYLSGLIEIQDEGSQLISLACGAEPGMRVLDACAGAGGKSLHLADLMHDRGTIIARDIEWKRLREIPKRARQAGIRIIDIALIDVKQQHDPSLRSLEPFDVVLVDAPCTGMGTVRRLPMPKWRLQPEQLLRYTRKQLHILSENASSVRSGGALVYATCSILPSENEDVVQRFLSNHPEFTLEAEQQVDPYHQGPSPGTDGLYWARLRRS